MDVNLPGRARQIALPSLCPARKLQEDVWCEVAGQKLRDLTTESSGGMEKQMNTAKAVRCTMKFDVCCFCSHFFESFWSVSRRLNPQWSSSSLQTSKMAQRGNYFFLLQNFKVNFWLKTEDNEGLSVFFEIQQGCSSKLPFSFNLFNHDFVLEVSCQQVHVWIFGKTDSSLFFPQILHLRILNSVWVSGPAPTVNDSDSEAGLLLLKSQLTKWADLLFFFFFFLLIKKVYF